MRRKRRSRTGRAADPTILAMRTCKSECWLAYGSFVGWRICEWEMSAAHSPTILILPNWIVL